MKASLGKHQTNVIQARHSSKLCRFAPRMTVVVCVRVKSLRINVLRELDVEQIRSSLGDALPLRALVLQTQNAVLVAVTVEVPAWM